VICDKNTAPSEFWPYLAFFPYAVIINHTVKQASPALAAKLLIFWLYNCNRESYFQADAAMQHICLCITGSAGARRARLTDSTRGGPDACGVYKLMLIANKAS
jgi:hypothetical protein